MRIHSEKSAQGSAPVWFTMMMLFVILPAVALAVDAGIWFTFRAKLQSAADSAALAAARSFHKGTDAISSQAAAQAAATKFYHLNIEGAFPGQAPQADPVVTFPKDKGSPTIQVTVNASAPTRFLHLLGDNTVSFQSKARVLNR